MSDRVRVQFEVGRAKLPTILQLLAGEVDNIATRDMDEVIAARSKRLLAESREKIIATNRKPEAGDIIADLPRSCSGKIRGIHNAVYAGIVERGARVGDFISYGIIGDILEAAHYGRTSYSSAVTNLSHLGVVKREGRNGVRILSLVMPKQ